MPRRPRVRIRYQPHPLLARERAMQGKVEADTGRSWDEWVAIARRSGLTDVKALQARLRGHLGLQPMVAGWIAHEALFPSAGSVYDDPEALVDALYSGDAAALRPVHDALVEALLSLGDDALVTACKTMVPVYRRHVFAELRPAGDAVELRLALGDLEPSGPLEAARGRPPGSRLTHAVRVRSAREIDGRLRGWMALAYAQGAVKVARPTGRTPPDLAKAVAASRAAAAAWASMTPARRRDLIEWVRGAVRPATRARRVAAAVARLATGRRRAHG